MKVYITTTEASQKWGVSPIRVAALCKGNKIDGAYKDGKRWMIPTDANKPDDKRKLRKQKIDPSKFRLLENDTLVNYIVDNKIYSLCREGFCNNDNTDIRIVIKIAKYFVKKEE